MGLVDVEKARELGWKDQEINGLFEGLAKLEPKHLDHEIETQELKEQVNILSEQLNNKEQQIKDYKDAIGRI